MTMIEAEPQKHGGRRAGAGRKPKPDQVTKVIRVPKARIPDIKALLQDKPPQHEIKDIRQLDPVTQMEIPLATERVRAGFPSPAEDSIDKKVDLNEHLIRNETATFIVKADSQSMLNIGIDINDELIVDRSIEAKHRDIVVVWLDNAFTVKRLMKDTKGCWLKAENDEYSDIYPSEGQQLVIWGVVTKLIKSFK